MKNDKYCNNCGCYIPVGEKECISCFNVLPKKISYNKRQVDMSKCFTCYYSYATSKKIYCQYNTPLNIYGIKIEDVPFMVCTNYKHCEHEIK